MCTEKEKYCSQIYKDVGDETNGNAASSARKQLHTKREVTFRDNCILHAIDVNAFCSDRCAVDNVKTLEVVQYVRYRYSMRRRFLQ